jgi:nucleoside 2-deoxyribosyltransferase
MSEITKCPLCEYPAKSVQRDSRGLYHVICAGCGRYGITEENWIYADKKKELDAVRHILAGLSREINNEGITKENYPEFTATNIPEWLRNFRIPDMLSVEEKTKKLLQYLRRKTEFFGQEIEFDPDTDFQLAYARNQSEFQSFLRLLDDKEYADMRGSSMIDGKQSVKISLSGDGWELANSLKKKNNDLDQGFIAMWFNDELVEVRDNIQAAITETGYKSYCIWNEHFAERIMDKALGSIRSSRFVVVDLTGSRGSVFFEAGFAHGLGVETIYVFDKNKVEAGSALEFYVRHYQCYGYDNPADLKEKLVDAIKARIKKA